MPKRTSRHASRSNSLSQAVDHAASSFGRWATTDHLHVADICKANLSIRDTITMLLASLILRTLGLLGSLAVIYAMIFYGLPWFLFGELP